MKTKIWIVILIITVSPNLRSESLRQISYAFTQAFTKSALASDDFVIQLRPYIDPSCNVDSICKDYYAHWTQCLERNGYPITTKVERIIRESNTSAVVLISNVWHYPNGEMYYLVSQTNWNKKGKKWYRSMDESQIMAFEKIDLGTENQMLSAGLDK